MLFRSSEIILSGYFLSSHPEIVKINGVSVRFVVVVFF